MYLVRVMYVRSIPYVGTSITKLHTSFNYLELRSFQFMVVCTTHVYAYPFYGYMFFVDYPWKGSISGIDQLYSIYSMKMGSETMKRHSRTIFGPFAMDPRPKNGTGNLHLRGKGNTKFVSSLRNNI